MKAASIDIQNRIKADRDIKEQQKLLETAKIDPQFKEIRKVRDISFVTGLGIGALITVIIYKIRS